MWALRPCILAKSEACIIHDYTNKLAIAVSALLSRKTLGPPSDEAATSSSYLCGSGDASA